ncbi:MAG TPA: ArsA family ATPase [Terriglobales bacterium]|nr:ArsA family ATPase [Terriglobales bacterium]
MADLSFFIGKGGVGKTTVSSGYAVREALRHPKKKVLLLSTDPAHSLSDIFEVKLGAKPLRIKLKRPGQLFIWQINADKQFRDFLKPYRKNVLDLLENGTIFSREEVEPLLDSTLPGMAEVAALLTIHELLQSGKYDRIVVDTAPLGHTLRLFELPQHFRDFLAFLDLAGSRDRWLAHRFGGGGLAASFVLEWERMVNELTKAMTGEDSHLALVTSAEAFSLNEALRAVDALEASGLRIQSIVLNRIVSKMASGKCGLCTRREKRTVKARTFLKKHFPRIPVQEAEDPGHPIMGAAQLAAFAAHLFDGKKMPVEKKSARPLTIKLRPADWPDINTPLAFTLGKGGVGKTTISAALAYHRRRSHPKHVTVCSTDPAPSLDDVFLEAVGPKPVAVLGDPGFHALEVDSTQEFKAWAERMQAKIDRAFSVDTGSVHMDLSFDRQIFSSLLDIVPPGVDEIFAIFKILNLLESNETAVVIDMAPTGHALELLKTPDRMLMWARLLLKTLAVHRTLPLAQDAAVEIATLNQRLRELTKRMQDQKSSQALCVMLPEPLAMRETERLIKSLHQLHTPIQGIFINRVAVADAEAGKNPCSRCASAWRWQSKSIAELAKRYHKHPVYLVENSPDPVAGKKALQSFTKRLWRFQ